MNVELRNICKTFGSLRANDRITLSIPSGTICGILGENGAGKSTLLKILSGFLRADEGDILLDGRPASVRSPADGIGHGIGMLHQDPLDFPPMTVLDNFLIGRAGGLLMDRPAAAAELSALAASCQFSLDPEMRLEALTVGERQQLEILRLLSLGVRVLILDEPTTGISDAQKGKLFAALRRLAAEGRTVIFVSHKLADVEQLCGHIAVLRQGRLAGEADAPFRGEALVGLMFGKSLPAQSRSPARLGDTVLALSDFAVDDSRLKVRGINLHVRSGEVIGLAGANGSGQELFLRACAGLVRSCGGAIAVTGRDLSGKPYRQFLEVAVSYLPSARLEAGLIRDMTLAEHLVLSGDQRGALVDWPQAAQAAGRLASDFNIKAAPSDAVESLSGGNQQRFLMALLRQNLSVLLLDHPTRGLDVESAAYIWQKLRERCRDGTCVLFASSDLDELLSASDRILVFFNGAVSAPMDAASATAEELGALIGGEGFLEEECSARV
jgi:general nucleoside transport system ATP-binding protein